MPKLEEGNLWVRATLPQDASYETGAKMAHEIREFSLASCRLASVSQMVGPTMVPTSPLSIISSSWCRSSRESVPGGLTKDKLISQMDQQLEKYPGIDFNFSQNIQDNVEEAMSESRAKFSEALWRRYRHAGRQGR